LATDVPAGTAIDRLASAVRRVSQLCGYIAAGLVAFAVVVVCHMVFVRYVLNQSTIWQTDLITYCITAATFIGSPYVLMTRGHVNVNVLPLHLRPRGRLALALFAGIMSFAFCAVMTVMTFLFWKEAWDNRWVSDTMWRARLWIPYASMPIGLGLLTLQYVIDIADLIRGRQLPFDIPAEGEA
jgi:TRAP-type C4-dicarboxylate transport system permease small subunit